MAQPPQGASSGAGSCRVPDPGRADALTTGTSHGASLPALDSLALPPRMPRPLSQSWEFLKQVL